MLPDPESHPSSASDESPAGRPILIVEDSDDVRRAVAVMLESEGYATVQAKSAAAALADWAGREGELALVLADMFMPGMDGLAFARELRIRAKTLPIVLVSGRFNENMQRMADEAGFAFLGKPFQSAQLFEMLQDLLNPPAKQNG